MGSDRVRVEKKSSSTLTPGFKPKPFSFLQPRYQDQVKPETDSFTEDKQQNSSEQSNPRPPLVGHSFGQVSVLPIQTKLAIGQPNDKYEQEADRVASQVVQQIHFPSSSQLTQGQSVQRMDEPEEEELQKKPQISTIQRSLLDPALQREAMGVESELPAKTIQERSPFSPIVQRLNQPEERKLQTKPQISVIQRSLLAPALQREVMEEEDELQAKSILQGREVIAGGEASPDLDSAINSAKGSGQPLDKNLQESMGEAMGADFSRVRIHADPESDQLNQSIQAKAFTTGQDVFFRMGQYQPGSRGGQELIAHELTHVVQQNGSFVNSTSSATIGLSTSTRSSQRPKDEHSSSQIIQRTAKGALIGGAAGAVGGAAVGAAIGSFVPGIGTAIGAVGGAIIGGIGGAIAGHLATKGVGTVTPQDNFAGRSTTRIGVGEILDLGFNPRKGPSAAQLGGLRWVINAGGGTVANNGGNTGTGTYTADGGSGNVTLQLETLTGNVVDTKTLTVIEPNAVHLIHDGSGIWHVNNVASVGFRAISYLRPTDVSFSNIQTKEGTDNAVANGYLSFKNGEVHAPGTLGPVGNGNSTLGCKELYQYDTIATGQYTTTPYSAGDFTWNIPIIFNDGNNGDIQFTTLVHREEIDNTGAATIRKGAGGPFTKQLNDPSSSY